MALDLEVHHLITTVSEYRTVLISRASLEATVYVFAALH